MKTVLSENTAGLLEERLRAPSGPALRMTLRDVSWIHYAILPERLAGHVPEDRFDIYRTGDQAWVSVVTFQNSLFPGFSYRQTNLRTYVIDKATGEPAVWFFSFLTDTLLAPLYRRFGGTPHEQARFFAGEGYGYRLESDRGDAEAVIQDRGEEPACLPGFNGSQEMKLVLLHPRNGFFRDSRGGIGSLSVWHPQIDMTAGEIGQARFEPLERLGLLRAGEALHPAGVFLSLSVPFWLLPGGLPKR